MGTRDELEQLLAFCAEHRDPADRPHLPLTEATGVRRLASGDGFGKIVFTVYVVVGAGRPSGGAAGAVPRGTPELVDDQPDEQRDENYE